MKIILFSGSHSRHIYVHKAIAEKFEVSGIVAMNREDTFPVVESEYTEHDQKLFVEHFRKREEIESKTYGNLNAAIYQNMAKTLYVSRYDLNSRKVSKFVEEVNADVCFVFGPDLILNPVLEILPHWRLNLHLGLSPWYRGAATLFWPFYFLEPQFAGSTIHQIIEEPDAGDIIHQCVPHLEIGDGIHDVGAKVVVESKNSLIRLLDQINKTGVLPLRKQKMSGKNFLFRDFKPYHLRVIYDLFQNKIVDEWLKGNLGSHRPKIVDGLKG